MKQDITNHYALLERDVREAFPDDGSVNEALRVIAKAARQLASRARKTRAAIPNSGRSLRRKPDYFILNNIRQRPHQVIYPKDALQGVPIYDYDDKQAAHAFNSDFQEMLPGTLALIFGKDRRVKDIFRVTGTGKESASDLGIEVFVIRGEHVDSLPEPIRNQEFIVKNKLTNANLDSSYNFRRGMLVAHLSKG